MRVLLTGGAGFIGSHIADRLTGHEVVVLDAYLPQAHRERPQDAADVTDLPTVVRLLENVDAVCHQAAVVGHGLDPSDAPLYAHHNDYGTAVLLAAMHEANVKHLVMASSMVVYGEGRYRCAEHGIVRPSARTRQAIDEGRYEPPCPRCNAPLEPRLVPEDAPLDPRSTYAASKLAQEHYAAAWARQTNGHVWALRYHNVYGARMPKDTPYAGVASLFRSALERGEAPTVLEDGRQRRDFVHVSDVARANVLALETPGEPGTLTPLNICSGEPHTVADLATHLAHAYGGPEPRVVGGARPADVRHVVADPAKAREVLGFEARTSFADGVEQFATDPLRRTAKAGQPIPAPHPDQPAGAQVRQCATDPPC
ncbi:NAD-dependent epimerase/dehydratase family protein [Actinosynnema sp. CS-041913]|uniref:NAD-dependent epimerase/dehydratase family protein n=1 Tax=Actinosynnema sp. CS-041913 TaxID=3239917 RepID=UPI003D94766F